MGVEFECGTYTRHPYLHVPWERLAGDQQTVTPFSFFVFLVWMHFWTRAGIISVFRGATIAASSPSI